MAVDEPRGHEDADILVVEDSVRDFGEVLATHAAHAETSRIVLRLPTGSVDAVEASIWRIPVVELCNEGAWYVRDHRDGQIILERVSCVTERVALAVDDALAGRSRVDEPVLALHGMSSPKVRHFLNNIVSYPGTRYLEIGTWKGSTFIAAVRNNPEFSRAVVIDNWSQCPRDEFRRNMTSLVGADPRIDVIDGDSFAVDTVAAAAAGAPFHVYFYDGGHKIEEHERAFTAYDALLAQVFVAAVDDWNDSGVQEGTRRSFAILGYEILWERELPATHNGDVQGWWNGLYVAVVRHRRSL